ncbi:MAG TPA: MFS transporter [Victivallales bacterium]|nr:MFS transporter [Victivallales bacterium]
MIKYIIVFIILFPLGAINSVLYAPALPYIQQSLHLSTGTIKSSITYALLGYTISQVIYGPLANIYGRKRMLITGMTVAILGSILSLIAAYSTNFNTMLISRIIVGLGAGSGLILVYTMINDLFTGVRARQVTCAAVMAVAFAPGISSIIGGYLTHDFGYRSCFICLLIINIIGLSAVFFIKETYKGNKIKLNLKEIYSGYKKAIKNYTVLKYSILYGLMLIIIYNLVAVAPFISTYQFKMSASRFGTVFFFSYLGYASGNICVMILVKYLKEKQMIKIGITIISMMLLLMLCLDYSSRLNALGFFIITFIMLIGIPFVIVNSSVLAFKSHNDKACASAIVNFVSMAIATISVTVLGYFSITNTKSLIFILIGTSIAAILINFLFKPENGKIKVVSSNTPLLEPMN